MQVQEKTLPESVKEEMSKDKLLMFHLLEDSTREFISSLNTPEINHSRTVKTLLKLLLMKLCKPKPTIQTVAQSRRKMKSKEMLKSTDEE